LYRGIPSVWLRHIYNLANSIKTSWIYELHPSVSVWLSPQPRLETNIRSGEFISGKAFRQKNVIARSVGRSLLRSKNCALFFGVEGSSFQSNDESSYSGYRYIMCLNAIFLKKKWFFFVIFNLIKL
jgi:hypothetical protein